MKDKPERQNASRPTRAGSATARAPGVCGELVQGMMDGGYFLVTCPIDFYCRVTVTICGDQSGITAPAECPKTREAVAATLSHLGQSGLGARVTVSNPIPRSKGMGSSSADVSAAIAATASALGERLPPETIARIAVSVEPSDGVMIPGIALFDHRKGSLAEELGPPPPMEIVALDFGGEVDTVEFNRQDHSHQWESVATETNLALELVRRGIREGSPALVGEGASISAEAGQAVLEKPQLARAQEFARYVGAVGICAAHSGTVLGVLIDARERRGKSTFRQAREAFPEAETVQHFRMMGGGVQLVH